MFRLISDTVRFINPYYKVHATFVLAINVHVNDTYTQAGS